MHVMNSARFPRLAPAPRFGTGSPTQDEINGRKLAQLADTIRKKMLAGQIEFKGALIKSKESDADLAKLVVKDPGGKERVYLVSRFVETSQIADYMTRTFYLLMMYEPSNEGSIDYKNPLRTIQLIDGPGDRDQLQYCDNSVPPGQDPILVKSQQAVAITPFRDLMTEMERQGLFNPNAALEEALREAPLDF